MVCIKLCPSEVVGTQNLQFEEQALPPRRILYACNRYKDLDPDIVKWMLEAAEKYNLDHEGKFNRFPRGCTSLDPKHYTKLCTAMSVFL